MHPRRLRILRIVVVIVVAAAAIAGVKAKVMIQSRPKVKVAAKGKTKAKAITRRLGLAKSNLWMEMAQSRIMSSAVPNAQRSALLYHNTLSPR